MRDTIPIIVSSLCTQAKYTPRGHLVFFSEDNGFIINRYTKLHVVFFLFLLFFFLFSRQLRNKYPYITRKRGQTYKLRCTGCACDPAYVGFVGTWSELALKTKRTKNEKKQSTATLFVNHEILKRVVLSIILACT